MTTKAPKNEKYLKYQKGNIKYRMYRRKYEKDYREDNKILWNLKSWKKMQKNNGKRITLQKETLYLMSRLSGEGYHI